MTYIVNRRDRFYVVAYDGVDPISGRERRRWHPAGTSRDDAEDLSRQLERDLSSRPTLPPGRGTTLGRFLVEDWLPRKRRTLAPTTAYRYAWMIDHYLIPRLGHVHLRRLRANHFDDLYAKAQFDPDAPALDSLKRTFHTFLGVLDDHAEAAFFLRAPDGCQQEQETGIRFVRTLLERGIARGELAPVDPDAAARVVVGTFTEAMLHILDTKQFDQTVDVVERMIDALDAPAAGRPA